MNLKITFLHASYLSKIDCWMSGLGAQLAVPTQTNTKVNRVFYRDVKSLCQANFEGSFRFVKGIWSEPETNL